MERVESAQSSTNGSIEMTDQDIAELKADFLEWSGGTLPESEYQITVHCDYAMPTIFAELEVRDCLRTWT
mgnify:CR=1 FL=1